MRSDQLSHKLLSFYADYCIYMAQLVASTSGVVLGGVVMVVGSNLARGIYRLS